MWTSRSHCNHVGRGLLALNDPLQLRRPSLQRMPFLGREAMPDVNGPGYGLSDLAGMVQQPGDNILAYAHGCELRGHGSPQIVRRGRVVSQSEFLQCPLHSVSDTMGRQMLLALHQSRSWP